MGSLLLEAAASRLRRQKHYDHADVPPAPLSGPSRPLARAPGPGGGLYDPRAAWQCASIPARRTDPRKEARWCSCHWQRQIVAAMLLLRVGRAQAGADKHGRPLPGDPVGAAVGHRARLIVPSRGDPPKLGGRRRRLQLALLLLLLGWWLGGGWATDHVLLLLRLWRAACKGARRPLHSVLLLLNRHLAAAAMTQVDLALLLMAALAAAVWAGQRERGCRGGGATGHRERPTGGRSVARDNKHGRRGGGRKRLRIRGRARRLWWRLWWRRRCCG